MSDQLLDHPVVVERGDDRAQHLVCVQCVCWIADLHPGADFDIIAAAIRTHRETTP